MSQYTPNALFQRGPNFHLNACIGMNGGPYDYGDFSRGYFSAGKHLVEALNGSPTDLLVDLCVYPIVLNYRHGIELGLKHAIVVTSNVSGVSPEFPRVHCLDKLWVKFLSLESTIQGGLMSVEDRDFMSAIIKDIMAIDPNGSVFRYPENKRQQLQIDACEHLDLGVLYEAMTRCSLILDTLGNYLAQIADSVSSSANSVDPQLP